MVVVYSGGEGLGQWREETRNVYDDYKRAFSKEPHAILAVGVMTDTDNTQQKAVAYYGDIAFVRQ